jgi:hypothetical protein
LINFSQFQLIFENIKFADVHGLEIKALWHFVHFQVLVFLYEFMLFASHFFYFLFDFFLFWKQQKLQSILNTLSLNLPLISTSIAFNLSICTSIDPTVIQHFFSSDFLSSRNASRFPCRFLSQSTSSCLLTRILSATFSFL